MKAETTLNFDIRDRLEACSESNLVRCPFIAFLGLLLGLTSLFRYSSPFPVVLIGALSGFDSIYALAGTLTGFLISGGFNGFAENLHLIIISTTLAVFRLFTGRKQTRLTDIATAVMAGAGVFITTLILMEGADSAVRAPAFGLVTGFGTLAVTRSVRYLQSGKILSALRPAGFAALGFTYALLIAALANFEVSMLNLGVFAASLCAVSFAYKMRYAGGAVCGAAGAFGIITANPGYAGAALAVCIAAMTAALFTRLGKYTHMAGYVLSVGIFAAFTGIDNYSFAEINSIIAGGILFLFVPGDIITRRFRREVIPRGGAEVCEIFAQRLKLTGEAMGDVKQAIEKTAEILDRAGSKEISWVYNTACGEVCRRCRHNMTCWGSEYNDTVRVMSDITSLLKKGKTIKSEHLYGPLAYRCGKREQLAAALNAQYREYTAINTANRKIAQMRTILLSQISATQTMMLTMSGEFGSTLDFDRTLAYAVESILFEQGISEPKAAVSTTGGGLADADSRMTVEAYGRGRLNCSAEKLCDRLSVALRREFDLPEIIHSSGEFLLTMFERAAFSIEYGVYQVSRGKEKNCGDYFDSFIDKKGFAYIILSDGMGSGGRARIDSAFACGMLIKLLRAGVDINAAIEIINNSLLVKSADESFATLDVCRIDLYSGNVELFKAGSAPTYISCNRRVVKANGKGLPVGINHRPVYERQTFTIGNSDIIIMASDGAELSERWLEHELDKSEWGKDDMNHFAETIATAAKYSSDKEREDDISVIAVKLVR
ncbi:MAG: SpoIIE family protein phosphatase [Oscillospiraceae bacterium]|jgi:stage II sporulation protein E|nr:SpoIIE family protein phosphatase [Oscillospiraceae bacterium]